MRSQKHIAAVVLAAGQSRRMGEPKLVMPWGERTIIAQVVSTLQAASIEEIVVVTGGARREVEVALSGMGVHTVYNPNYTRDDMLFSLQTGTRIVEPLDIDALLVVLGDQPAIEEETIRQVVSAYHEHEASLVIPSYQMRRGHPWLVGRSLWGTLLAMKYGQTMRDFIQAHQEAIDYVVVDRPSVLLDLDTPEDYNRQKPVSPKPH